MSYRDYARIGWRARIGVIAPATGMPQIADFNKIAPEGVAVVVTTPSRPLTEDTVEQLTRLGEDLADAAKQLARVRPDVILWACTTGSLMKGYGYDQELSRRMEEATNIPATTTATAVVAALRKLRIRKLCIALPYIDKVNEIVKKFLEDNGFQVLRYKGLQLLNAIDIIDTSPFVMYQLVKEVDLPEADGIFISCTGLNVLDIIEKLECDLGKPVVTSNQASFWQAFQIAKVGEPIQGYGRLLREPR
jgi:maleate isomerase